jgi:hypothetical protein
MGAEITLNGRWTSPQPEPIPNADGSTIYGVRDFTFAPETWRLRFTAYGDADAKHPLFTLRAEGHYTLGDPSVAVPGAREAEFHFARRLFTAHTEPFVELLNGAGAGSAPWTPGVEQDVSITGALFVPSMAQAPIEHDLVAFRDGALFLGDRSGDLSKARPAALGAYPLARAE